MRRGPDLGLRSWSRWLAIIKQAVHQEQQLFQLQEKQEKGCGDVSVLSVMVVYTRS